MKIRYGLLTLVLSCSILILACSEKKDPIAEAKKEVMKIHDDAMAELGTIRDAVFKLKDLAQSSPDSMEIVKVISELAEADDAMMEWMADYEEPEADGMMEFLEVQKEKISVVAEKMYSSISASKKYLNE